MGLCVDNEGHDWLVVTKGKTDLYCQKCPEKSVGPMCPRVSCGDCHESFEYDPFNTDKEGQVQCSSCDYWTIVGKVRNPLDAEPLKKPPRRSGPRLTTVKVQTHDESVGNVVELARDLMRLGTIRIKDIRASPTDQFVVVTVEVE